MHFDASDPMANPGFNPANANWQNIWFFQKNEKTKRFFWKKNAKAFPDYA
jgi:hypothetical protein